MGWISGELFAGQGLEDALTAGRDNFDVSHAHYRTVHDRMISLLHDSVFPKLILGIKERTRRQGKERMERFVRELPEILERETGSRFRVSLATLPAERPVAIDIRTRTVRVNRAAWASGQAGKFQQVALAFEVSRALAKDKDQSDVFYSLIKALRI